jgi:hypothetical protein
MYLNERVVKQTRNKRRSNAIANVLILYLEAESENVSLAQLRLDMCLTICLENGVLPSVMKENQNPNSYPDIITYAFQGEMTTLQLANHAMAKPYTAISRQGTSFSTRISIRRLLILAARRCVVRIPQPLRKHGFDMLLTIGLLPRYSGMIYSVWVH